MDAIIKLGVALRIFLTLIFFIVLIFISKAVVSDFEIIPIVYRYLIVFILHIFFFIHVLNVIVFFFFRGGVESKLMSCYMRLFKHGLVCIGALAFFIFILKVSIGKFLENGDWNEILKILLFLPFMFIPFIIFYKEYGRCRVLQSEAINSLAEGETK